jgi:hypothetical protein
MREKSGMTEPDEIHAPDIERKDHPNEAQPSAFDDGEPRIVDIDITMEELFS